MASHGPITDRIAKPTPDEVRAARERAGITQDQAGELVSGSKLPRRTWDKWEKPTDPDNNNNREIPLPTWELFLLMTDQHPTLRITTKRRGE